MRTRQVSHHANKGFWGRIKRMEDIWRMWRMVRLLAKKRFKFALYSIKTKAAITSYEVNGKMVLGKDVGEPIFQAETLSGVVKHHREPRALRQNLCNEYVFTFWPYLKEKTMGNGGIGQEAYQERYLEAEAIINSCIVHEPQFLTTEGKGNEQEVYLTSEGKKFASWEGWLKSFRPLIEELTIWKQLLIGTGLGTVLGFAVAWLIHLI